MKMTASDENSHLLPLSSTTTPPSLSKGPLLHLFTIFSSLTVFLIVVVFLIQMFLVGLSLLRFDVIETGIRLYLVVFSVIAILIELEITTAARSSSLCQSWEYRGFGYVFLGLLHAYTYLNEDFDNSTILFFLNLSAYGVIFSGLIYIILGLLNLKKIRDEKMARYIQLISFMEVENTIRRDTSQLPGIGIDSSRF